MAIETNAARLHRPEPPTPRGVRIGDTNGSPNVSLDGRRDGCSPSLMHVEWRSCATRSDGRPEPEVRQTGVAAPPRQCVQSDRAARGPWHEA
jgi:hypothetical protein